MIRRGVTVDKSKFYLSPLLLLIL